MSIGSSLNRISSSEWNQKNLFCGWYDADLSDKGLEEAKQAGKVHLFSFDTFLLYHHIEQQNRLLPSSGSKMAAIHSMLHIHQF
jgi:bisphosphoglycerate-dependent phosphoglycerate mutase